jgi:hypothetical protein
MATIDDLEREVRKLRQRVNDLHGVGREEQIVAELVDNSDGLSQPSRHGFADAVAQSNAAVAEDLERQAIALLRSGAVGTPGQVHNFHQNFSRLGFSKRNELLSKYSR